MIGLYSAADRYRMGRGFNLFLLDGEFAGGEPAVTQGDFQHGAPQDLNDAAQSMTCIRTGIRGPRSAFVLSEYGPVLREIYRPEPKVNTWPQSL